MTVRDVQRFLEQWAPPYTAWERDNVGLQIGNPANRTRHVLLALDVTPEVVREAHSLKADVIVSHHPLLFRAPKAIRTDERLGAMVHDIARSGISVLAAHTNLDFARGGVSFALASRLGLVNVRFLTHLNDHLAKIVVFVPESHTEAVADAMARAGAGVIGQYTDCSFRTIGTGTYRGSPHARPYLGKPLKLEHVPEARLEMVLPRSRSALILAAMRRVHPYEEVAYDLFDLHSDLPDSGHGVIGELPRPMRLKTFVGLIKKALQAPMVRFSGHPATRVHSVALCGGAGSELLEQAIMAKADVFLTADVRYHTFHEATGRVALVDAGHYETEIVILRPLAQRLRSFAKAQGDRLAVSVTRQRTNPIQVF